MSPVIDIFVEAPVVISAFNDTRRWRKSARASRLAGVTPAEKLRARRPRPSTVIAPCGSASVPESSAFAEIVPSGASAGTKGVISVVETFCAVARS